MWLKTVSTQQGHCEAERHNRLDTRALSPREPDRCYLFPLVIPLLEGFIKRVINQNCIDVLEVAGVTGTVTLCPIPAGGRDVGICVCPKQCGHVVLGGSTPHLGCGHGSHWTGSWWEGFLVDTRLAFGDGEEARCPAIWRTVSCPPRRSNVPPNKTHIHKCRSVIPRT